MASMQDASVGMKVEGTWGTPVTVDRWYEFKSESLDLTKTTKTGVGLRVGSRVARSGRRVIVTTQPKGDVEVELTTKGMGYLWTAALGAGTSTVVSGSTYQQNYTLATGVVAPGYTIQKGVVNTAGTVDPYTFAGMCCTGFEVNCPEGDIATAKFSFAGKSLATATAYTAPSYVAAPVNLFHFAQGAITVGGTVTAPTTTALATGGTAVANVKDFSLKVDNKLAVDRFTFGGAGLMSQPTYGLRDISGSMTVEYDTTTLRDAFLADTPLAVALTFTSAETLSTGTAQFQIVLPEIKLNGQLPNANGTDLVTVKVDFDVLDNLTAAQPLWIVHRTADSAV